jgi:RNA-directed DNA polymerase
LELKPSKTRITYTLDTDQEKGGFDFLGFNVRQYRVGKTHAVKNQQGRPLGFKTFTKPNSEAIKRHLAELAHIVKAHREAPQGALIAALNPVIVGWANYYSTGVSKDAYSYCDHRLYQMLRHWARTRHPNKNARWVVHKYWAVDQGEGWRFKTQEGIVLRRHATTPIRRHVKVKKAASPYDGNLIYWAQRLKDHPLTRNQVSRLLRNQAGRCRYCGLFFRQGDVLEVDHILPRRLGGSDYEYNLQVLHRHCHDQKIDGEDTQHASKEVRCS